MRFSAPWGGCVIGSWSHEDESRSDSGRKFQSPWGLYVMAAFLPSCPIEEFSFVFVNYSNCILFKCDQILNKILNISYLPTLFHSKFLSKNQVWCKRGNHYNGSGLQTDTEPNNRMLWPYSPIHSTFLLNKVIIQLGQRLVTVGFMERIKQQELIRSKTKK